MLFWKSASPISASGAEVSLALLQWPFASAVSVWFGTIDENCLLSVIFRKERNQAEGTIAKLKDEFGGKQVWV
ncbi:MAG: hypothetical protein EPO19_05235 [Betaproteobacteria bacterium]|nr:MAG: hypothetical protein EPO19_05235 [Betaproteobacteria bacterium]